MTLLLLLFAHAQAQTGRTLATAFVGVSPDGRAAVRGTLALTGRAGVRVDWLAFWGPCFVGRVDRVAGLDGLLGWWEVSGGLAGRL